LGRYMSSRPSQLKNVDFELNFMCMVDSLNIDVDTIPGFELSY